MSALISRAKAAIKTILGPVDSMMANVGASSSRMAGIYWLVRGGFGREQQAVLAGKKMYRASLSDPTINTSLLRRNTHRIEKGMLMRPRRVPFGLTYIEETVHAFHRAVSAGIEPNELAWARDVLLEYMAITPSHPQVDPLREIVLDASEKVGAQNNLKRVPYHRDTDFAPSFNIHDFIALAKHRRSVRWYASTPIPREMIALAVEAATYSPTACNRQPYEFRIFDSPELVSEIIRVPGGTAGFNDQVPAVAVIVGKLRNYFGQHDRHAIYTDASLAIMSFVYALELQGIGSCCINWPDIEEREQRMGNLLRLEADERPVMLVSFGWPDKSSMVAYSEKKPASKLCRFNHEPAQATHALRDGR
ncbi:nitroreductase family protein [Luteimonas sp. RC10]|uniref:nitroreductase family protein n=1 Tax=Luteimonas sp. RC10 TaxID=2587035 RepID=UPI00161E1D7D|nr:nitroreductase family protein [Luteimonas sp. RC10]MBB3344861.1 nitroreductase [Luteimonas sp. RC10]